MICVRNQTKTSELCKNAAAQQIRTENSAVMTVFTSQMMILVRMKLTGNTPTTTETETFRINNAPQSFISCLVTCIILTVVHLSF